MTNVEILRWAISGVDVKREAFLRGHKELKGRYDIAADKLLEVLRELNEIKQTLVEMLTKSEEEELHG